MRIVDLRERTVPIASPIANAYIDFSKMTLSLVAIVTDVMRDGKPVIGYGFNSNGRYGQGALIRERFLPRLMEADPASLIERRPATISIRTRSGLPCSRTKSRAGMASARSRSARSTWRSGMPSRRSTASRCSSCSPTDTATGHADRKVFVYAAGGYYYPGKDIDDAERRDAVAISTAAIRS